MDWVSSQSLDFLDSEIPTCDILLPRSGSVSDQPFLAAFLDPLGVHGTGSGSYYRAGSAPPIELSEPFARPGHPIEGFASSEGRPGPRPH